MFHDLYNGRRVFLTGHSGFKGSHLAFILGRLGAEVCGYALPPPTEPSHFELLGLPLQSVWGDIRDADRLRQSLLAFRPEIVFHLAAQPLVRASYRNPVETFEVNVRGAWQLLEACRECDSVRAVVVVSSDKCYENREQPLPYREEDPLGGFDPYSASKGCVELVAGAYSQSFFNPATYGKNHRTLLASARAGNVVGGGDWAADRLIPDLVRGAAAGRPVPLRRPDAVRPWQHVFEPLAGYLLLGQRLLAGDPAAAGAWNFGPDADGEATVAAVAAQLQRHWPAIAYRLEPDEAAPHEAGMLLLDCAKAKRELGWSPVLTLDETLALTADWYRAFYAENRVDTATDFDRYCARAAAKGAVWMN